MSIACQVPVIVLLYKTGHTLWRENLRASSKTVMYFYEGRVCFVLISPIMLYLRVPAFLAHKGTGF